MSLRVILALGKKYQIGQLYDIKNDEIVSNDRVWSETELEQCVIDSTFSESEVTSWCPDEIYHMLDIDDHTRCRVESGLYKPEGVGRILQDERYDNTGQFKLQQFHSKSIMIPEIERSRLEAIDPNASHVIAGITYGGTVLCWFDEKPYLDDGEIYHDLSKEIAKGDFESVRLHVKQRLQNNPAKAVPVKYHLWPNAKADPVKYHLWLNAKEELSDPPGKPTIVNFSNKMITLQWAKPARVKPGKRITGYKIYNASDDTVLEEVSGDITEVQIPILPNKKYQFVVQSKYGTEESKFSPMSEEFEKVMSAEDLRKEAIKEDSKLLKEGSPSVYLLNLRQASQRGKIRKFEYGNPTLSKKEKVVMLVGATGSGKTTLINSIMNYILGISWTDNFRIQLIPEEKNATTKTVSQTRDITSYTIYHQEGFRFPYTLTLVDTPGFGDTAGIKRDQEITKQMTEFFTVKSGDCLDHIDAIGFVAQSSLSRLTPTQKYIFDSILALFGKDVKKNVFPLLTFADINEPLALEALKKAEVPCVHFFKFNNSMFTDNSNFDSKAKFYHMYWKMCEKSYKSFLDVVVGAEQISLSLTKDVLKDREYLESQVESIQNDMDREMHEIEKMKKEYQVLEKHKADIAKKKSFTYKVTEKFRVKKNIPAGTYVTNCLTCNRTCHYPCYIPNDKDKSGCAAIKHKMYCRICPGKCHWEMHKNMHYKYVDTYKTVKKTDKDLFKQYRTKTDERLSQEQLLECIAENVDKTHVTITQKVLQAKKCIVRLHEIALKPIPLSTVDYVDLLIAAEKQVTEPGWHERVTQLKVVKKRAAFIESMTNENFDPFEEHSIFKQTKDQFAGQGRKMCKRKRKFIGGS